MPSIKKTKSFKVESINDNLKGKKKRFAVMKIIPDDVREKAKKLAQSLAESTFLEQDKKVGESIFSVPANFERVSKEITVDRELVSLRHYIFTIQACRTCALNFNDQEETMRVIEKTEDEEIIEIRKKYKKPPAPEKESEKQPNEEAEQKCETAEEPSTEESVASEPERNKPIRKIYYINRIIDEDNIYIVFLRFDPHSKQIVKDDYDIIAAGEKKMEESEELKCSNSGSFDVNENYELDSKSKDNDCSQT